MLLDEVWLWCFECATELGTKFMVGERAKFEEHLDAEHNYTVEEAHEGVQKLIDDIPTDDNGYILQECPDHGFFSTWECKGCRQGDL